MPPDAVTSVLRLAVAGVILLLLARSARVAWRNRRLAVTVWRRIRPRHVAGSLVLLTAVLATAVALLELVPVTSFGLGTLIGLTGNAVFAPIEEATARGSAANGGAGIGQALTWGTVAFLVGLLTLFPWLAYVEERVFREGLERADRPHRLWAALRFGLAHLIMLVPVAAALAIGIAGLWYGRVYVRAFQRAARDETITPDQARSRAVLESTVWHTTFNSLLVVLLIAGVLTGTVV
jgi:hypothetical protein